MGWSIGWDGKWNRDIGYGVPAHCDHPGCRRVIDRGLSYVCGSAPYGGDDGCGLFFCWSHLSVDQLCQRCKDGMDAFEPKKDHKRWIKWKLKDPSWKEWREANPEEVKRLHHEGVEKT